MHKLALLTLPLILGGCVLDNNSRQERGVTNLAPNINVPPPTIEVKEVNTDKLVEDTSARVSQRIQTDLAANQAQLSGHIAAQLHKLEADISELIKIENTVVASAELSNKMEAVLSAQATLNATLKAQVDLVAKLEAKLDSNIQADVTAAGYAGEINKTMQNIREDIKASAGRDVNLFPPAAVEAIKASYENANDSIGWIYKLAIGLILAMKAIVLVVAKRAYDNARARQDDYAKLLMKALGKMDPTDAQEIKEQLK